MENEPQYAKYSLQELLEVKHSIDRDKYPNRAAKVDEEIEKRKENSEKIEDIESLWEDNEDDDDELNGIIWDFQEPEKQPLRWLFISTVILVHVLVIGYLVRQAAIPEYTELPEYLINVEAAKCIKAGTRDNRYYEFMIRSWGHNFYAVDIQKSLCDRLAKTIPKKADVKIWHLNGVIFHMTLSDKVILSHQYLRHRYRSNRLSHQHHWIPIALVFWALFAQSFVNAIRPGTFIQEE